MFKIICNFAKYTYPPLIAVTLTFLVIGKIIHPKIIWTIVIIITIILFIIYFVFQIFLSTKFYIWFNYLIFKVFKQPRTHESIHALIHLCREHIICFGNQKLDFKFLNSYIDIISKLLNKIIPGFNITLKILDGNNFIPIRVPDISERNETKKRYENERKENIFLRFLSDEESCDVVLSKDIKHNILNKFCIDEMKLIKKEPWRDKIPIDIIKERSQYYRSICNYPIKITLTDELKEKINEKISVLRGTQLSKVDIIKDINKINRLYFGALCIDHKKVYVSYFIGKRLRNLLAFFCDLLFTTMIITSDALIKEIKK